MPNDAFIRSKEKDMVIIGELNECVKDLEVSN